MFKKDKGKVLQFANGVLLIATLITATLILQNIINVLLPVGGDYSNFILKDFLFDTLTKVWTLLVFIASIFIINKKYLLFDARYVKSKKLLNLILLTAAIIMVIYIGLSILSLLLNTYHINLDEIRSGISIGISYGIGLLIVNNFDILSKENTKGLNLLNFTFIIISLTAFGSAISKAYDYIYSMYNVIDITRDFLLLIITGIVFMIPVILMNRKKTK
jgi:hypothetical protein